MQNNTKLYNTIQYNAKQYKTIKYKTIKYNTKQHKHELYYSGINRVEFRGHLRKTATIEDLIIGFEVEL